MINTSIDALVPSTLQNKLYLKEMFLCDQSALSRSHSTSAASRKKIYDHPSPLHVNRSRKKFHRVVSDDRTMNTLSVRDLCCLFCCPPLPSRIAAKLGKRVIFVHTR